MTRYNGFESWTAQTIQDALDFARKIIETYTEEKKKLLNEAQFGLVEEGLEDEVQLIDDVTILREEATKFLFELWGEFENTFFDTIRSALEIYLRDTSDAKKITGFSTFDKRIEEINRIINFEGLKSRKSDLFIKYYSPLVSAVEGKRLEVFLSYSNKDKTLAGKIAKLAEGRGIETFLAHEHIEISNEWRGEILKHLAQDRILIALLTLNYEESVWANQEAGYMIGKGGKVIPLVIGDPDLKKRKIGFLESFQGVFLAKEEQLEECVEKIINLVVK